ncbi:hypothetical protein H4R35_002862 [Dimargaris xerosporica]|nr:hypothetical protein H4R35_002862 [Dimargaris xerosporica]
MVQQNRSPHPTPSPERNYTTGSTMPRYTDRIEAGEILASKLASQVDDYAQCTVLALSRPGLVVANVVGQRLHLPVGVLYVRQVTWPVGTADDGDSDQQLVQMSIGAVTSADETQGVWQREIVRGLKLTDRQLAEAQRQPRDCLNRALQILPPRYLSALHHALDASVENPSTHGSVPGHSTTQPGVILVDDGIASGDDVRAAIAVVQRMRPELRIVVATPVGVADTMKYLGRQVYRTVTAFTPPVPYRVPCWYQHAASLSDEEQALLHM